MRNLSIDFSEIKTSDACSVDKILYVEHIVKQMKQGPGKEESGKHCTYID